MQKFLITTVSIFVIYSIALSASGPAPSNGIPYPHGWRNWPVIGVSYREDNHTIRVILGNRIAVKAAREGRINPWPEGTVLVKVVWKVIQLDKWKSALEPGKLVHVEIMVKDSKRYAKTYNWGWARWIGREQKPFNKGPHSCISCHRPVKERDWVYTIPAHFP